MDLFQARKMAKHQKIAVKGLEITIYKGAEDEYISLTDLAKHKDANSSDDIFKNWLCNRNTIELLGFWEPLYNPAFYPVEFDGVRNQAGLNQAGRFTQLHQIAITQMTSLVNNVNLKKLK